MNIEPNSPYFGVLGVPLLCTKQAARHLNVSHRTLEDWRLRGGGPFFRKLGGAVRYAFSDLVAYAEGSSRRTTGCDQTV
jgi:hypothetical protein